MKVTQKTISMLQRYCEAKFIAYKSISDYICIRDIYKFEVGKKPNILASAFLEEAESYFLTKGRELDERLEALGYEYNETLRCWQELPKSWQYGTVGKIV